MDLGLSERVVLVVGGTGLIGGAVVQQLRGEGAIPIAASRGGTGDLRIDAEDDASVRSGIAVVLERHGRLDGLVVAAAPSARSLPVERNSDPAQVAEVFAGKALTFLRLANAVLPVMTAAAYGRVVVVSGQNAYVTGNLAGSVRNAAVIVAAQNLADSVAGTGVTVNVVNPATVTASPSSDVAVGRGGDCTPEDVATLVTFLVSPAAGALSGASVPVGHRVRGTVRL